MTRSYSITDDSSETAELVADGLSRDEAIVQLFQSGLPLHRCYVTCWDESTIEEDGTHPIEWQKSGEEFMADIFNVPVTGHTVEVERQRALEEALQCLTRVAPLLLESSQDEEYRYAKAVTHRVDAAIHAEPS